DRECFGWATTSRVSAWSHGPGQKLYPYRQKSHRDHYLVAGRSTKSRQLMLDRALRLPANGSSGSRRATTARLKRQALRYFGPLDGRKSCDDFSSSSPRIACWIDS